MRAFFDVLMMLGVAIIAGLVYVTLADRQDAVVVESVAPGSFRAWQIGRCCLWLLAIGFSVLCCCYAYWLYQAIPATWELVVIR